MTIRYTRPFLALFGAAPLLLGCGTSASNDTAPPTTDSGPLDAARDAIGDDSTGPLADAGSDAASEATVGHDGGVPASSFVSDALIVGPNLPVRPVEPFTFHLSDARDSLIVGWHGDVASVAVQRAAAGWSSTGPVTLNRPCAHDLADILDSVTLTQIAFHETATGIAGTLAGNVQGTQGDVFLDSPMTSDFTADVDRSIPALGGRDMCGTTGDLSLTLPLASIWLVLSEPLVSSAAAQIVSATDGAILPLPTDQTSGPVTRFGSDFAFAFGSVYQVAIQPFVDLGGVAGGALPKITTPSLGFAAADGFETDSPMEVTGGAAIVTDPSAVISGMRSLQIPGPGGFAMRLKATPTNTTLTVNVRAVIPANCEGGSVYVSVGVPEGKTAGVSKAAYLMQTVPMITIENVSPLSVALPPGVNGEVIVQVETSGGSPISGGPGATFIVDDVRLQ